MKGKVQKNEQGQDKIFRPIAIAIMRVRIIMIMRMIVIMIMTLGTGLPSMSTNI